jgi:hypothetical protein
VQSHQAGIRPKQLHREPRSNREVEFSSVVVSPFPLQWPPSLATCHFFQAPAFLVSLVVVRRLGEVSFGYERFLSSSLAVILLPGVHRLSVVALDASFWRERGQRRQLVQLDFSSGVVDLQIFEVCPSVFSLVL